MLAAQTGMSVRSRKRLWLFVDRRVPPVLRHCDYSLLPYAFSGEPLSQNLDGIVGHAISLNLHLFLQHFTLPDYSCGKVANTNFGNKSVKCKCSLPVFINILLNTFQVINTEILWAI